MMYSRGKLPNKAFTKDGSRELPNKAFTKDGSRVLQTRMLIIET